VTFKNVITLAAHDAGVTVQQNRLFGLFNRPVLIPWDQLTVGASGGAAPDLVRVRFGNLEKAVLVLPLESWEAIERHRPEKQP